MSPRVGLDLSPIQADAVTLHVVSGELPGVDRLVDLSRVHAEDLGRLADPHQITLSTHTT